MRHRVGSLTEWNSRNAALRPVVVRDVLFSRIMREHLPSGSLECLEIGAVPGRFLVWLHRELGYRITGIDFSDTGAVFHETMELNGISEYEFVKADFLTYEPGKQFDVVCSFGFVEHFNDVLPVIQKHCDLVKPGGYFVLEVPNYRWLQFAYHWLFDRKDLAFHNTAVMKSGALRRMVEQQGFDTMHSGYDLRMKLWREARPLHPIARPFEKLARVFANRIGRRLPDSRFTSAALICVFRRPADVQH